MKKRFAVRAPSPSMAVALMALFVALGGTSYAAATLAKNSVGTKQLKNGAVTTKKIKNHAVTASKINATGLSVPNAAHANSADGLTTLPSGHSESGVFATADGDSGGFGYIGLTITYARPLAAAISPSNIIDVHGASGTHCSGIGHADPGYLCLYDTDTTGTTGTVFYSNTGPDTGAGTLGVVLYWTVGAGEAYTGGSWTVTAP